MPYDYTKVITWIESLIDFSVLKVRDLNSQIEVRLQQNDLYVLDIAESIVVYSKIIEYFSNVKTTLNHTSSPADIISNEVVCLHGLDLNNEFIKLCFKKFTHMVVDSIETEPSTVQN